MEKSDHKNTTTGLEIAVIGMACRFPGAKNFSEFWSNLTNGVESVTLFPDQELAEAGIPAEVLNHPHYVKALPLLEDIDGFDAAFFSITPREAEFMDPQIRIFYECAWSSLEDAGYVPDSSRGGIGLYAGAAGHPGWEYLSIMSASNQASEQFSQWPLRNKDFLSTRVSFDLDLKGPSLTIYTACSTSLVAVHIAYRALLAGECKMALAGGVTATRHQKSGYYYQEDMIASPDGHCRAFDAQAAGTAFGDGVGVVVLKRLKDAIADGDNIYAVIKGSSINNDGKRKIGYTAPSIDGQSEAIRVALRMAQVEIDSITYVETHGTGTVLGDPAEIEGLKLAFKTDRKQFCAVGSVKTNLGHLDIAAGIAGFIKTVLALKHRAIPASLHFETPNPQIDFINSPFYVNTRLTEWESDQYPLRAGVSSFGIGGTNVHVVLEEWPNHQATPGNSEYQLIVLTAKTQTALDKMKQNLARYLSENPDLNLGDMAYTLQVGRKVFKHRWMAVCSTRDEAIEALTLPGGGGTETQISLPGEAVQTAEVHRHLLTHTGRLWLQGEDINWNRLYSREKQHRRYRVSLPTYPFERQPYWLKEDVSIFGSKILPGNPPLKKDQDITDWFYLPSWKRSVPDPRKKRKPLQKCKWLVFVNELNLGKSLVNKLIDTQQEVVVVKMGATFGRLVDKGCYYTYGINPKESSHYESLFKELEVADLVPDRIIHCWHVTGENDTHLDPGSFDETQYYGFFSLLDLTKAIGKQDFSHDIKITVLTDHLLEVIGGEPLHPEKSTLLGLLKSIPQEYPGIRCSCFDILLPESGSSRETTLIDTLLTELTCDSTDTLIAFRNNQRWVETFEPLPLEKPGEPLNILREQGVYLIAGGLGNIGLIFSELLVNRAHARLVLTGRSAFPSRDEWREWLNTHDESEPVSLKIKKLQKLEEMGGQVLYIRVDISDLEQMRRMISYVEKTFGNINGVIHSAGIMEGQSMQSVQQLSHEQCQMQFNAKVYGLLVLEELFRDKKPDFFWILSSISSVLGGLGLGAYASANLFMDAFIKKHTQQDGSRSRWFGLNWDGMDSKNTRSAFERVFSLENIDQLLFSNGGFLQDRIDRWIKLEPLKEMQPSTTQTMSNLYPRPDLPTAYVAPRNSNEKAIIKIWQELLGYNEIGANDDFLQLGGDSLKAITAISRIYKQLNINIPVTEFFNKPTAAGIADYILSKAQKGTFASIAPVEKKEFYPVSSAQKRLYVLQQLDVKNTRYNLPMAFRLEGAIEIDRVVDTFNRLIQRHESFRTSFEMREDEPTQIIHDTADFDTEYYNQGNGTGEDVPEVKTVVKNFLRYFDLARAPLFRAGIIKLSEEAHILMVDMHHIVSDGTSLGLAITEFMALYVREKLPGLRIQYKDFSRWQRQELEFSNIKKQEEYWLNRFKGNIPGLDMPLDYPRPTTYSANGKRISFQIEREITAGLKQLILETETTLYIVLLAAYNILLSKYSGQEDIVVGTPIAGRHHADLESVIGVFANMLAMRNQPQKEKSLKEFLKEVKINALNAYENQDYQFEELIWNLKIKAVGSRNPLFDVVFVLQNTISEEIRAYNNDELKKIKVSLYETPIENVHYELLLNVSEGEDVLFMCVEYSTELYKEDTARKILKNFVEILQQIIEDQDISLKDIKISHDLLAAKPDVILDRQNDFRF